MEHENLLHQGAARIRRQHRHRHWRSFVTGLGAVVVFVTVYLLILPAITQSRQPQCGLEEHTHTEDCYTVQLTCETSDSEAHEAPICGLEEAPAHTHTEQCLPEHCKGWGEPICGIEESGDHVHTPFCYESVIVCDQDERAPVYARSEITEPTAMPDPDAATEIVSDPMEGQTAPQTPTEGEIPAASPEQGDEICVDPGHTHGVDCAVILRKDCFVCQMVESEGHTHMESCYQAAEAHTHDETCYHKVLTCEQTEHTHTDACYPDSILDSDCVCGLAAHTHDGVCLGADGELLCGMVEHTHTDACLPAAEAEPEPETDPDPVYDCGLIEHIHTQDCYNELGELLCGMVEHTHTDACLPAAEADPDPESDPDAVYYCGKQEHRHTEDCYNELGALGCGMLEHTHTARCAVETEWCFCGYAAHTHGEDCMDEWGDLICGLCEHEHTDACRQETLMGAPYTRVDDLQELDPDKGYAIVLSQPEQAPVLLCSDGGNLTTWNVTMQEREAGQTAVLIPQGVSADEEIPQELLWVQAQDMDIAPDAAQLTGAAGGEAAVTVTAQEGSGWLMTDSTTDAAPMARARSRAMPGGSVALYEVAQAQNASCPNGCALDDRIDPDKWVNATGTNPFGTAQDYNLFLLGDMHNWGVIHGNAAIMGNISGTNQHITYDPDSKYDYSANAIPHYETGLVLGGKRDGSKITVNNGSVVAQESQGERFQMDRGDDDHFHAATQEQLGDFFKCAKSDLENRNQATYNYCIGLLAGDEHLGNAKFITDKDMAELGITGATVGEDVVLTGTDPFYNAFNLDAQFYSGAGSVLRNVFLNVPFGSYTMINIKGRETIENFGIALWYKDSNGKFIQQPADKSQNDNYTQTQRTLLNFNPEIQTVVAPAAGYFLYASVLGPNVTLEIPENAAIHMLGTIVLKNLKCETASNNSSIIYNPFMAGSQLSLTKKVSCDSTEAGHNCTLARANWENYYADLTLQSVDAEDTGSDKTFEIKALPLDGKPLKLDGLTPGEYRITQEKVYKKAGDTRINIDTDGALFIMEGEQKFWCDANGDAADNKNFDPNFADHYFSHAFFGNNPTIYISPGDVKNVEIVNHYGSSQTVQFAVRKQWLDEDGNVLPAAPEGARIKVDLYRKLENSEDDPVYCESVYLDESKQWYHCWTGLPKADENGNDYAYGVIESEGWPGFDPKSGKMVAENGVAILKNWKRKIEPNSLTVEKKWYDESGNAITGDALNDLTATVQLYRQEGKFPDTMPNVRKNTVSIYLDEIGEDNLLGFVEVYQGSDIKLKVSVSSGTEVGDTGALHFGATDGASSIKIEYPDSITEWYQYYSPAVSVHRYRYTFFVNLEDVRGKKDLVLSSDSLQLFTGQTAEYEDDRPIIAIGTQQISTDFIEWNTKLTALETIGAQPGMVILPTDDAAHPWTYNWTDLPTYDETTDTYYRYFVFETKATEGYVPTYHVEGKAYPGANPESFDAMPGVASGFIIIRNQKFSGHELPEAGGTGVVWPMLCGALLTGGGLAGLVKRRKGGRRRRR